MVDDVDSDPEDNQLRLRSMQPDPSIDTSRVEEILPKEPMLNAVPLKSALKKRCSGGGSGPGTPTQEGRPLAQRQEQLHASFKSVSFRLFPLSICDFLWICIEMHFIILAHS